jgi:elongin-A
MPAPRLLDLAKKACVKNVKSASSLPSIHLYPLLTPLGLNDVGSLEYFQISDVLKRITSPEQLHEIEIRSPQIRGEDAELWQAFIARDIPKWEGKNYRPKNPMKWYEVYCRYKKEQAEEIKRDEEILRNTMMGLQKVRQESTSKIVDLRLLPKVPRDPRMIANNGGVPLKGRGFKKDAPSSLLFTSGSRTKLTNGQSVLTRARREAKEISQMGKLSRPTHQLSGPMGQVRKAPTAMVNQYKTAAQPAVKILSRRKHNIDPTFKGGISGPSLEEREARLRAAMSGTSKPSASSSRPKYVDSEDEDEGNVSVSSEKDDLFDDQPPKSSHHPSSSSPARPAASSTMMKPRPRPANSTASPMMPRKREVDVFNRGANKKRRVV